ncbi:MaoC family dehydratase [Rhodobacteraceae bacterium 63075]|nr:MaoC family dehydratase [Rhodobacteraceae bacterium 63075]
MGETRPLSEFESRIGEVIGVSRWYALDAERIRAFADITEDWQPIHLDEEVGRASPFGTTVAHGFLTMSLLSAMIYDIPEVEGTVMGVNYGFDQLRFVAPVPTGARIRGHFTLAELDTRPDGAIKLAYDVTVEIEGQERPALAARWIGLRYLAEPR